MLLYDINGHNFVVGFMYINGKNKLIEDFISKHILGVFNDKPSTYLHPASGLFTFIDHKPDQMQIYWIKRSIYHTELEL